MPGISNANLFSKPRREGLWLSLFHRWKNEDRRGEMTWLQIQQLLSNRVSFEPSRSPSSNVPPPRPDKPVLKYKFVFFQYFVLSRCLLSFTGETHVLVVEEEIGFFVVMYLLHRLMLSNSFYSAHTREFGTRTTWRIRDWCFSLWLCWSRSCCGDLKGAIYVFA